MVELHHVLNPVFDRFRYCKFLKDPKNSGIEMALKVLNLKSKCFKDLSSFREGLISPLRFQNPYLPEESAFSNGCSGCGLCRSTVMTAPVVLQYYYSLSPTIGAAVASFP